MSTLFGFLLYGITLAKMIWDNSIGEVVPKITMPGFTDDPADLILSIQDLGGTVTDEYGPFTFPNGNGGYFYVVNVSKKFPDNTIAHNIFVGNNELNTLQEALNWLVFTIQFWRNNNPGY